MDPKLQTIKRWIFIYFWLLIFEGALRKWVFPQLATPLLLVRDPVVLMIYYHTYQKRLFPKNIWTESLLPIIIGSLAFTFISGHRNLEVAIYGIRTNFLHIPLIFVMAKIMNVRDVERILTYVLYLIPPVTILLVVQFYSPPNAWVNVGIGGEGTAGFGGALGRMRPPTLFSFISGTNNFYSFATVAVCWSLFMKQPRPPKILIFLNVICILLAVPMSISRTLMFSVLIVLLAFSFGIIVISKYRHYLGRIVFVVIILIFTLPYIPFLNEGVDTFVSRWDSAKGGEDNSAVDGTVGRVINSFTKPLAAVVDYPVFGLGLGMGTNAGAKMMTGNVSFLIDEVEWGRLIGEMGVLGLVLVLYRVLLAKKMLCQSWSMALRGHQLAWLLASNAANPLVLGTWGQPSNQGFATLFVGLAFASLNLGQDYDDSPLLTTRANSRR